MKTLNNFTKKYPISKTLRFALQPVGRTQEMIEKYHIVSDDEILAKKYKKAKKIIDAYHKQFIHSSLSKFNFDKEDLEKFRLVFDQVKKDKTNNQIRKEFQKLQETLRKQVADCFDTRFLFDKDFIVDRLPKWLEKNPVELSEGEDAKEIIKSFNKWTTYFGGFNENRKNIYSKENISTGIAYRIIHDNLPKFCSNIKKYEQAKTYGVDFGAVEENNNIKLETVFKLDFFNSCLTQEGIDRYNIIRGGFSKTLQDEKTHGINECINLFAQTQDKDIAKKIRGCKLEELYKQILSDRTALSFRLDNIKNDGELMQQIYHLFHIENSQLIGREEYTDKDTGEILERPFELEKELLKSLEHLESANAESLYIKNNTTLTNISQYLFDDWSIIENALRYYAEKEKFPKKTKSEVKERQKWIKNTPYFSFHEIHIALEKYFERFGLSELEDEKQADEQGITKEMKRLAESKPLFKYFRDICIKKKNEENNTYYKANIMKEIAKSYEAFLTVYNAYKEADDETLKGKKGETKLVKEYLDNIQSLNHFFKPLILRFTKKEEQDGLKEQFKKDASFYTSFEESFKVLSNIVALYNQTRNHLTKKISNTEKYKLNFKHYQGFLGGFVDNVTKSDNGTQYGGYLFRKKNTYNAYDYFIGVSKYAKYFRCNKKNEINSEDKSEYERLEYYQAKGPTYFSPEYSKTFKDRIKEIALTNIEAEIDNKTLKEIRDKKNSTPNSIYTILKKEEKKGSSLLTKLDENQEFSAVIADTIKNLKAYNEKYTNNNPALTEILSLDYTKFEGLAQLINNLLEVAKSNKVFSYFPVSNKEFEDALINEEKPLYLFKICNKDLNMYEAMEKGLRKERKATKNLHTLYFEHLMSGNHNVIDIGKGEIFHRKKAEFKPIVHLRNEPILCKSYTDQKGNYKTVTDEQYKELSKFFTHKISFEELSAESKKIKDYIKTKVFDYDIIKNKRYTENKYLFHLSISLNYTSKKTKDFNNNINTFLKNNPDVNILGIDRGERHLAYYSLIDQKGKMIKSNSFNVIHNKDYHDLLDNKEKERKNARLSWGEIEKIKDIKEGYLSQVVHEIVKIVVEHNAIVVFEDLNFGFKRGRFGIEKQIYQKLEKMLIDKLNYLVFKDKPIHEPGGLLNGLQLTDKFESFEEMGKQTGILFYTPAYHTSKICPKTGFVNLLYPHYETIDKSKEFFSKFDKIVFNEEREYVEFHTDYRKFGGKIEGCKPDWVICSYGERIENFRDPQNNNQWNSREISLTKEFIQLFEKYFINYQENLSAQILQQESADFFKRLTYLLKMTLQLRNSKINTEIDYIVSPIADKNGSFYDSRQPKEGENLPKNADENGAYHIALKGLYLKEKIDQSKEQDLKKSDLLKIENAKWYQFVQAKEYRKK